MNTISLIGLNHKTAPIEIRERFYMGPLERELLLSELKNDPNVLEAFVLSTCNRIEVYAHLLDDRPDILFAALLKVKKTAIDPETITHFYVKSDEDAVNHLFEVACGLDSLVIGEKQILGQVREAMEFSAARGMMSRAFNVLSNIVLQTGKKARRETQIDFGGSSVSWASVVMAQDILGSLQDKVVLILGSGKMGRLAVEQLNNKGVKKIYIMNRTTEKAEELAKHSGGVAVPFWEMKEILPQVDVCICSASCTHYLIDKNLIEKTMQVRNGKKLVCIDISMPRNIDPEVAGVSDVFLVSVDNLDKVVHNNIQKRLCAAQQVEKIIKYKVQEFYGAMAKIRLIEKKALILQGEINENK